MLLYLQYVLQNKLNYMITQREKWIQWVCFRGLNVRADYSRETRLLFKAGPKQTLITTWQLLKQSLLSSLLSPFAEGFVNHLGTSIMLSLKHTPPNLQQYRGFLFSLSPTSVLASSITSREVYLISQKRLL